MGGAGLALPAASPSSFALRAAGSSARAKGNSFWLWFLISGLVPFFGLLAAVLSRSERQELRRRCPRCGKVVKMHDALCTRCGSELEFPEPWLIDAEAAEAAVDAPRAQLDAARPRRGAASYAPITCARSTRSWNA